MTNWDTMSGSGDSKTPPPEITVARAVQRLAGRAVRRALLPLIGLLAGGVFEGIRDGITRPTVLLVLGAISSGIVMLLYGVQSVRRVLGRSAGAWGPLFWVASWIPYVFGTYVVIVKGVMAFASPVVEVTTLGAVVGTAYLIFGVLMVRAQWRLSEVHALSQEMLGLAPMSEMEIKFEVPGA
jgi:uncharacterized membrane protein HdeD (DUF308 family)